MKRTTTSRSALRGNAGFISLSPTEAIVSLVILIAVSTVGYVYGLKPMIEHEAKQNAIFATARALVEASHPTTPEQATKVIRENISDADLRELLKDKKLGFFPPTDNRKSSIMMVSRDNNDPLLILIPIMF